MCLAGRLRFPRLFVCLSMHLHLSHVPTLCLVHCYHVTLLCRLMTAALSMGVATYTVGVV